MAGPARSDWDDEHGTEAARRLTTDPARLVGEALLDLAHRFLDANKTKVGAVTTGDTGRGRTLWGYGRSGRPCRRCGTLIKRGPPGQERVRFWSPRCQE